MKDSSLHCIEVTTVCQDKLLNFLDIYINMSKFLDLCEKFFDTRDYYEILKIEKDASEKDGKKSIIFSSF